MNEGTREAQRSTEIARIVADHLMRMSFPAGSPLEYFPPTYHGERIGQHAHSHIQPDNYLTIAAAEAGHAYFDLIDLTGDETYRGAAARIAGAYLKTQLESGSWFLYVIHLNAEPTAEQIAIPTAMIALDEHLTEHVLALELQARLSLLDRKRARLRDS